jgi:hypothetical protein
MAARFASVGHLTTQDLVTMLSPRWISSRQTNRAGAVSVMNLQVRVVAADGDTS